MVMLFFFTTFETAKLKRTGRGHSYQYLISLTEIWLSWVSLSELFCLVEGSIKQ